MQKMFFVRSLCEKHTDLLDEDIAKIESLSENLTFMANVNQANVFIDCLLKGGKHAIVVAEGVPHSSQSVYTNSVVGKIAYEAFESAVFSVFRTGKEMYVNRALTQEGVMVSQSVAPIFGKNNRIIGVLIMEKAMDDSWLDDFELWDKGPFVPEFMEDSLFLINHEGRILYTNPAAINLVSEICSKPYEIGTHILEYFPSLEEVLQSTDEILMQDLLVGSRFFQIKKFHIGQERKTREIFIVFKDMTELREKERALVSKSVAIREIHHRVKNNLQTVASLLRLQMRREVTEDIKPHLLVSLNRVLSISVVYEIILASSNVDHVEILDLIKNIGDMIVYSEDQLYKHIEIKYAGDYYSIDSSIAVSVALIVNELIHNCMKHAFKGRDNGLIEIHFQKYNQELEVVVVDNGSGYSLGAKPSLGLDIVRMTVENDLLGKFSIENIGSGTKAAVRFPFNR